MRIGQARKFLKRRFHIDAEPCERVERLQHIAADLFVSGPARRSLSIRRSFMRSLVGEGGKLIRKKCRRRVRGLEERQRMFADPVIPIRMRDPGDIEFILKTELELDIGPPFELVEYDAVVDPLDSCLGSVAT